MFRFCIQRMKYRGITFAFVAILSLPSGLRANDWQTLFNGKDLAGWRANVMPESFTVVNGAIRANATRESAHLFYVGDRTTGFVRFKNFELEATVRGEPNSNSGIYIHTEMSVSNAKHHLAKGYEIQLNNTAKEQRKTGSLYDVVDLSKSSVDGTKWFRVRVTVQDKHIQIAIDDQKVVDYIEPADVKRPKGRAGRVLNPTGGAIALQAHDPGSIYYFKDIRSRQLP
jgi:hypothetical protein